MTVNNEVKVKIDYQKSSVEFSGDPTKVLILINDFFSKQIPNIDLANKISINYSVNDIMDLFKEYIRITDEGPVVWNPDVKLSDKLIICLQLVVVKIAFLLNKLSYSELNLNQIEKLTGLKLKSVSSRLSELVKLKYETLAISRSKKKVSPKETVTWLQADLSQPLTYKKKVKEFNPDVVIHLAWQDIPDFSFETSSNNLSAFFDLMVFIDFCNNLAAIPFLLWSGWTAILFK